MSPANPSLVVVVTSSFIKVFNRSVVVHEEAVSYTPTCVAINSEGNTIAVGGQDKRVHFYAMSATGSLEAAGETDEVGAALSVLEFSPDGTTIATGDATREVRLYSVADKTALRSVSTLLADGASLVLFTA